ncbi:MAG: GNAT family N-acetyltransferase [Rhizobiaceae bacterium]|nr:MAG: GNAT family N-acetyltransferase [Rhizobiaceae bacterium]
MKEDALPVVIRLAERGDIGAIVALFADDSLGGHGDTTDETARPNYETAFEAIAANPASHLYVAERAGQIVGTFQTTTIRGMSRRGASSLLLTAVQTRRDMRSKGIGRAMVHHAVDQARACGAAAVQLMSNSLRVDAHRFYEREGFVKSHTGFKMKLR